MQNWRDIWESVKERPARISRSLEIPRDKIVNSGVFADKFTNGEQYFSIIINEIFATHERRWFDQYDPAAFVVTEFSYDGKPTVVPFVVSPAMLEGKIAVTPNGVSITDTKVAGVHPFAGGSFAVTIVIAEVKRSSYAKDILDWVGKVSSAFPMGAALTSHLKISETVISGIEALLGLADTRPMAAHRFEYHSGTTDWLRPGFHALLAEDESQVVQGDLHVVGGRLRLGPKPESPSYRRSDFALYSLCTQESRPDIGELPFNQRFKTALRDAVAMDEGAWDRAKATLLTIYQELLTSPDLTWQEAHRIAEQLKEKLVAAHERAATFGVLSAGPSRLGASTSTESQRDKQILKIHELLRLG